MTIKKTVRTAEYFNLLTEVPTQFKVKYIEDMERQDFHILRHAGLIEKVPDAMGKECVWTLTDDAEEALDSMDESVAADVPELSKQQIRFIEKHEEFFGETLSDVDTDDGFLSRDVDIGGRTPEGMMRYGLFHKIEQKDGHPTVWGLTDLGEQIVEMEVGE
mgnify:CR=1 FL=1